MANREYCIPDTEYTAIRSECVQTIIDSEGDTVDTVPYEWNEPELIIWGMAYDDGYHRGRKDGDSAGMWKAQREIQKGLGIYDELQELRSIVKDLERNEIIHI